MIHVEDATMEDFERKRVIQIIGSEREISALETSLVELESIEGISSTSRRILHDFTHSLTNACGW